MNVPPGFSAITPYLFADGADALLRFLIDGLGGELRLCHRRPDGMIGNAQVRIGPASLMLSEASADWPAMPASLYLYVADADAAMQRAMAAGAQAVMPVADQPYGDRQGGVRDPAGNLWWISQRLVDGPYTD